MKQYNDDKTKGLLTSFDYNNKDILYNNYSAHRNLSYFDDAYMIEKNNLPEYYKRLSLSLKHPIDLNSLKIYLNNYDNNFSHGLKLLTDLKSVIKNQELSYQKSNLSFDKVISHREITHFINEVTNTDVSHIDISGFDFNVGTKDCDEIEIYWAIDGSYQYLNLVEIQVNGIENTEELSPISFIENNANGRERETWNSKIWHNNVIGPIHNELADERLKIKDIGNQNENLNFFTGVMPLQDGYFTTKIGTKIEHAYTEHNPDGTAYNVFKIKVYLKQKMNVDKITLHLANPVQIANFDNVDGVTTDYSYFNHENSEIEINNINSRYATVTELRNALHTYKANTHDAWCNVRNFEGTGGRQTVQLNYCHHYRGMRHDEFSAGMPDQTTTSLSAWKGTYAYIPNTNIWVSANGNKQISNNIRISSKANTIKTINTYSGIDFSGSNTMRLSSEGKIGIGTNLPESEIEVIGSDMTGRGSIKISKPDVTTSEVVLTDDVYNTYASKHNQRIERDISGSDAIPIDFTLNNRKTDTITVYWKSNSLFQNFKITEIVINDILNTSYEISPILEINNITQNNSEYQDWSGGLLMNNEIKWDNDMYRTVKPYTKIYDGYSVELENEIFEYFTIQIKLKQPSEVNKLTLYMHGIGDRLMDYVTRVDVDTNRTMFYPLDGYDVSLAFTETYPVVLRNFQWNTGDDNANTTQSVWEFNLNTKNTTEFNIYWYNNGSDGCYLPFGELEINNIINSITSSPIESVTNFANGQERPTTSTSGDGHWKNNVLFDGSKYVQWTINTPTQPMDSFSYKTDFLTISQYYFLF